MKKFREKFKLPKFFKKIFKRKRKITEEDIAAIIRFYVLATKLKFMFRAGFDENHWNISKEKAGHIGDHIYGTLILAITIYLETKTKLNIEKVLKMLIFHEIGEVIISDITPFDNVSPEEKYKIEHEAIKKILKGLFSAEEINALLIEFDERKTKEAKFAFLCDKADADFTSKIYQDLGLQHPLDDQEGNIVMNNKMVQEAISNGAKTAFDVWYYCSKHYYENDEIFSKLLEYIKKIDTSKIE